MTQIPDFQNVLSWASSGILHSSCMSLQTQSTHLPLGLFPGSIMSTTARTSLFSSILCMCPYQCSLISLTFSCILVTPSSFLMSAFFTLSLSVTPLILLPTWRPSLFYIQQAILLIFHLMSYYRIHNNC